MRMKKVDRGHLRMLGVGIALAAIVAAGATAVAAGAPVSQAGLDITTVQPPPPGPN
jgi:hypothetical protein